MRMGGAEPGMLEIVGTLSACSSQLVLRMAILFDVTTDQLLRDELELEPE